jgi:PBP1b-binding outer membrane lipoprotein LpoB
MKTLSILLIILFLFSGCIGVRIYVVNIHNDKEAMTEFHLDMDLMLEKQIDTGLEAEFDPSIIP